MIILCSNHSMAQYYSNYVIRNVSFHDQAPIYIKNCLELYQPLRPNLRSSTDLFRICCPRTRTKAGDRTFTVTAAKAWNKLPTLIKSANSLEIFKKLLKTHLFPKT